MAKSKTADTMQSSTILSKTDRDNGAKKSKTPAKPISLYPMSEEEAVKRLLRVPPPGKDGKGNRG